MTVMFLPSPALTLVNWTSPDWRYDVEFSLNTDGIPVRVKVRKFNLLSRDFPCASWIKEIGKYRAWSSTVEVGSYNDWQCVDIVRRASHALQLAVPVAMWYV